ncbi:MAG: YggT family protein [Symploca sp. SIO2E6]|nr:YggT family protein [Symploca sp. SIO2E6]
MPVQLLIVKSIAQFFELYMIILVVRILLTWFQSMSWANQVASFLSPMTDPYLNIFRSFIPAVGGLDFSPIIAIFVLQILAQLFVTAASSIVL